MVLIGGYANAHQFLPTYPTFEPSFIEGAAYTRMQLFNKRKDVEFYELYVFDKDWNPVTFASENKLIQIKYLETKQVNVYVKNSDLTKVVFICTESKLRKQDVEFTAVASRICSRVK